MNFNHAKKEDIDGSQQGSSEQKCCKEEAERLITIRPVILCFQAAELPHIKRCLFMLHKSGQSVFAPSVLWEKSSSLSSAFYLRFKMSLLISFCSRAGFLWLQTIAVLVKIIPLQL